MTSVAKTTPIGCVTTLTTGDEDSENTMLRTPPPDTNSQGRSYSRPNQQEGQSGKDVNHIWRNAGDIGHEGVEHGAECQENYDESQISRLHGDPRLGFVEERMDSDLGFTI